MTIGEQALYDIILHDLRMLGWDRSELETEALKRLDFALEQETER
jgi:hypothetical protein